MEQKKSIFFYCYSIKLKDFLKLRGLRYEERGKHPNGNFYWKFRKGARLDQELKQWDKYKKNF